MRTCRKLLLSKLLTAPMHKNRICLDFLSEERKARKIPFSVPLASVPNGGQTRKILVVITKICLAKGQHGSAVPGEQRGAGQVGGGFGPPKLGLGGQRDSGLRTGDGRDVEGVSKFCDFRRRCPRQRSNPVTPGPRGWRL